MSKSIKFHLDAIFGNITCVGFPRNGKFGNSVRVRRSKCESNCVDRYVRFYSIFYSFLSFFLYFCILHGKCYREQVASVKYSSLTRSMRGYSCRRKNSNICLYFIISIKNIFDKFISLNNKNNKSRKIIYS